jgi:hypothetical protein
VRHASMRTKQLAKRQISRFERSACPSTTEGVPVCFSFHPSPGACETDLHSRVLFSEWSRKPVHVNETRTSEVGIAVTAKAPPARKARGVTSSDNADPGNRVKQSTVSAVICLRTAAGMSTEAGNG